MEMIMPSIRQKKMRKTIAAWSVAIQRICLLATLSAAPQLSCGGESAADLLESTPVSCGQGTVLSGDKCVAIDAGSGGEFDGSGGLAGEGGQPLGTGGAAGEGGDSQPDAEPPADGGEDAVADGAPGPQDDPCPDEPMFLNCSDSCGPKSPECEALTCDFPYPPPKVLSDDKVTRIIVRTPSHPGNNPKCKQQCDEFGEQPWASVFSVQLDQTLIKDGGSPVLGYRAMVAPPWHVDVTLDSTLDLCVMNMEWLAPCRPIEFGNDGLKFFTDAPDAPSRNIVIERLPNPVKCP